jgi:hypothetical protein
MVEAVVTTPMLPRMALALALALILTSTQALTPVWVWMNHLPPVQKTLVGVDVLLGGLDRSYCLGSK